MEQSLQPAPGVWVESARLLIPADEAAYRAFRRLMLTQSPTSYMSEPGFDRMELEGEFVHCCDPSCSAIAAVLGTIDGTPSMLAAAGIKRETRPKTAHRAMLWGVFTHPRCRRLGLARRAVVLAVDTARAWPGLLTIELGVGETAPGAQVLYESLGFRAWGVQPRALCVDGRMIADTYMQLALDG